MEYYPSVQPTPNNGTILVVAGPHKGEHFPRGSGNTFTLMNDIKPELLRFDQRDEVYMGQAVTATTYTAHMVRLVHNGKEFTCYVALPFTDKTCPVEAFENYMSNQQP